MLVVEGEQGNEQDVRLDQGGGCGGLQYAHFVGDEEVFLFIEAEDEGHSFADDDWKGDAVALGAEGFDKRSWVYFVAEEVIGCDDGGGGGMKVVREYVA